MIEQAVILSGYGALAVVAVALVVHARRVDRPDLGPTAYLAAIMERPVGRWLVLLLWLWTGWHFFVR
jgi:hypothetical protein